MSGRINSCQSNPKICQLNPCQHAQNIRGSSPEKVRKYVPQKRYNKEFLVSALQKLALNLRKEKLIVPPSFQIGLYFVKANSVYSTYIEMADGLDTS